MINFDFNQFAEQMKPAMEKAATLLGTTSEKLLEVGVKGMFVEGVYAIVCCLCAILAVIIGVLTIKKSIRTLTEEPEFESSAKGIAAVVFGIFAVCLVVFGLMAFFDSLKTAI